MRLRARSLRALGFLDRHCAFGAHLLDRLRNQFADDGSLCAEIVATCCFSRCLCTERDCVRSASIAILLRHKPSSVPRQPRTRPVVAAGAKGNNHARETVHAFPSGMQAKHEFQPPPPHKHARTSWKNPKR